MSEPEEKRHRKMQYVCVINLLLKSSSVCITTFSSFSNNCVKGLNSFSLLSVAWVCLSISLKFS